MYGHLEKEKKKKKNWSRLQPKINNEKKEAGDLLFLSYVSISYEG